MRASLVPCCHRSLSKWGNPDRGGARDGRSDSPHPRRPLPEKPAKQVQRRRMLEEIAADRFDYAEMSKRVLGTHWKPLTEIQRKEFVEVYKSFLSDKYAGRIEDYTGRKHEVSYLTERIEGSYAEVRTELRSDKTTLPMDYRLLLKEGRVVRL